MKIKKDVNAGGDGGALTADILAEQIKD